jgi:hypothetical protein
MQSFLCFYEGSRELWLGSRLVGLGFGGFLMDSSSEYMAFASYPPVQCTSSTGVGCSEILKVGCEPNLLIKSLIITSLSIQYSIFFNSGLSTYLLGNIVTVYCAVTSLLSLPVAVWRS